MKNEFENGRLVEDRLENRKKRKRKGTHPALIMFGCMAILTLTMFIATSAFVWLDDRIAANAQLAGEEAAKRLEEMEAVSGGDAVAETVVPEPITYSEEELQAKVQEAQSAAAAAASQEILDGLKSGLITGDKSMVEVLRPFYPNELVVVSNGQFHFVPIQTNLKMNAYSQDNLNMLETGEYQYMENGVVTSHKGIDVSKHQGNIDWNAVATDGVEFAFVRVGNRGYGQEGKLVEDQQFEKNVEGATRAGVKVGVYFYTQAITEEEMLEEANLVLEKIAPYNIECPVVIDVEKVAGKNGRMNALSLEERTNLVLLFCQTIENAGYKPMIYHNMEMGTLMLDLETLENYDKWFAYYNPDMYYPYDYKVWQYSEKGRVAGIDGDVDMNIAFAPLWEE